MRLCWHGFKIASPAQATSQQGEACATHGAGLARSFPAIIAAAVVVGHRHGGDYSLDGYRASVHSYSFFREAHASPCYQLHQNWWVW